MVFKYNMVNKVTIYMNVVDVIWNFVIHYIYYYYMNYIWKLINISNYVKKCYVKLLLLNKLWKNIISKKYIILIFIMKLFKCMGINIISMVICNK